MSAPDKVADALRTLLNHYSMEGDPAESTEWWNLLDALARASRARNRGTDTRIVVSDVIIWIWVREAVRKGDTVSAAARSLVKQRPRWIGGNGNLRVWRLSKYVRRKDCQSIRNLYYAIEKAVSSGRRGPTTDAVRRLMVLLTANGAGKKL